MYRSTPSLLSPPRWQRSLGWRASLDSEENLTGNAQAGTAGERGGTGGRGRHRRCGCEEATIASVEGRRRRRIWPALGEAGDGDDERGGGGSPPWRRFVCVAAAAVNHGTGGSGYRGGGGCCRGGGGDPREAAPAARGGSIRSARLRRVSGGGGGRGWRRKGTGGRPQAGACGRSGD